MPLRGATFLNYDDPLYVNAHVQRGLRRDGIAWAFTTSENNLGGVLFVAGRRTEAIAHFTAALRLRPDFPAAQKNLRRAQSAPP